jgi:hypothetical protein
VPRDTAQNGISVGREADLEPERHEVAALATLIDLATQCLMDDVDWSDLSDPHPFAFAKKPVRRAFRVARATGMSRSLEILDGGFGHVLGMTVL